MSQQAALPERQLTSQGLEVHPDMLPSGTVVGGFRLLRHVDTGSYGSVWQVESLEKPGRRFALKLSLYGPGEGSVADARAVREVHLLLRAAHENVVRVVAHGRWRDPDTGLHYMVLEWVEGGTLWQWARATRPNTRQVVRLLQKLARALQRAHEAGVLHRDIKPDNVLVRACDGEPFLSDFGVGDAQGVQPLTLGALPVGTLAFHSPQLLRSHLPGAAPNQARPADDWYALGVLLYQLLTEVRPYPEESEAHALALWVERYKPVAPEELNPRVPRALGAVALRLLSEEPHQRYTHGQALCAALERALATAAEPEAPLWPPAPPPDRVPTHPPTASDGPVAQDPEVLAAHAFREEEDPEEEQYEQVLNRRDMLLQSPGQRRAPRLWRKAARVARQRWALGAAAVVLLGACVGLGAWALGHEPAAPAPLALSAPQDPPPVAASPSSPRLAPLDASPQKEGSAVKTPQSPEPSSPPPPAQRPSSPRKRTNRGALCAAGMALAGCTSVPVRPTRQECPREVMKDMEQRGWEKFDVLLNPNAKRNAWVIVRPGPIISGGVYPGFDNPKGALLYGHVFFAEDGRTVVRYTEIQLEGGERVPICFAIIKADDSFDVAEKAPDSNEERVKTGNNQTADRVRVLPD